MNILGKSLFERASEPVKGVKQEKWISAGLATTATFVAVSVASAVTSAYRRRREGG